MNTSSLERSYSEVDRSAPAQSPFLPGTKIQFAWDSTSLGYLKVCPRLYQYTMLDGWGSRDESVHLRFGIEYHKALEDYDRLKADGASPDEALRTTVQETLARTYGWDVDEDSRGGKYKNRRSLLRTIIDYLDHFKDDPAETVILQNGLPAVELSFKFELDWGPKVIELRGREVWDSGNQELVTEPTEVNVNKQPYLLSGHLDRVVSFNSALFVMDRKTTTTTLSPYYFAQYEPSNQMTLYSLAAKVILESPIKGVVIDAAQILTDSSRFVRGFTYRTPDQLEEWTEDLRFWFGLAEHYATVNYWPMNDLSCGMYGGCRFRSVCSKSPQVREQFLKSDFDKLGEDEKWNPLKPR